MIIKTLKLNLAIFSCPQDASENAVEIFLDICKRELREKSVFNAAFSGGSTPVAFFRLLNERIFHEAPAGRINIFWADERCVPFTHPESNYGMCKKILVDEMDVLNFYPINGALQPQQAAKIYEKQLLDTIPLKNDIPCFDFILLGMGEDGHTASIFPETAAFEEKIHWSMANFVEKLHSWRITLTLPVLNNAKNCLFMAFGKNKRQVLNHALDLLAPATLPVQMVKPEEGMLYWLIDKAAAYGE